MSDSLKHFKDLKCKYRKICLMFVKLIPKLNTKELTMCLFTSHFFFQFIHFKAFKFNAFLVFSLTQWACLTPPLGCGSGSHTPTLYYKLYQWFSNCWCQDLLIFLKFIENPKGILFMWLLLSIFTII